MVSNSVVVPCTVLAAIAFCMLAFICWWFPRTWAKGMALDKREYHENALRRQRQRDLELAASEVTTIANVDIHGSGAEAEAHAHKQAETSTVEHTGDQAAAAQAGESEARAGPAEKV